MENLIKEIQETKESFSLNLDDHTGFNDFEYSKGLLWNFKKYFMNNKTPVYFLLGLSLQANAAALDNIDYQTYLKETIDQSNQIINTYYKEELPELSPLIIKEAILKEKDLIVKNPFWNKSAITIIFKTVDSDIYALLKNDVNEKTAHQINFISNQSIFFSRPSHEQEYISNFLNGQDSYFYPVTLHPEELTEVASEFSPKFKELAIFSVIYHEAAHASFEQTISDIKLNYVGNILNLSQGLYSEIHSDIAGIWMAGRKLDVKLNDFIEFLDEYIYFRSKMIDNKDYIHVTSTALLEFKNLLKNNPNIYTEIPDLQISVMSALITDYSTSKDYSDSIKEHLKKEGVVLNPELIFQSLKSFKDKSTNMEESNNLEKLVYKFYLREKMIEMGYTYSNRQEEIELAFKIGNEFYTLKEEDLKTNSNIIFSKYIDKNVDMVNIIEYSKSLGDNFLTNFLTQYKNKELSTRLVNKKI